MADLERFLGSTTGGVVRLRDGLALSRQVSADNAEALRLRNQEANEHRNRLARQGEISQRGVAAANLTRELIDHGRVIADGDPFVGEKVMETLQIALGKINGQI